MVAPSRVTTYPPTPVPPSVPAFQVTVAPCGIVAEADGLVTVAPVGPVVSPATGVVARCAAFASVPVTRTATPAPGTCQMPFTGMLVTANVPFTPGRMSSSRESGMPPVGRKCTWTPAHPGCRVSGATAGR